MHLVIGSRPTAPPRAEQASDSSSRFLARFGVTLFWVLAVAIVSARILVGV
jgi:hypothetical protein